MLTSLKRLALVAITSLHTRGRLKAGISPAIP